MTRFSTRNLLVASTLQRCDTPLMGEHVMDKTNIDNLPPEERFLETKNIEIDGMNCDNCVRIIEKALRGVNGVKEIRVDRARRLATVNFDTRKTHIPELHDVLLRHGYKPTPFAEPVS
jgi:copper chaperone CopZ